MEKVIRHVRDNKKLVATLVFIREGSFVNVGISACSDNDQFCRWEGRDLAYERAIRDERIFYVPSNHKFVIEEKYEYLKEVLTKKGWNFPDIKITSHKRRYPYAGRLKNEFLDLIVLFVSPYSGYLLSDNKERYIATSLGHYSDAWDEGRFEPIVYLYTVLKMKDDRYTKIS